ncbi:unnamed protein product [Closterium sp. Naga37s-1]|nr:unnamed protein product [Closterium sp. Naga37s-1]
MDRMTRRSGCCGLVETLLKYGPDDKEKRLLRGARAWAHVWCEWCDSLVGSLLKYGPDDKEKRLLREFKGNVEDLGPCEQLFRALLGVQRLEPKLKLFRALLGVQRLEPKLKVLQYRIFLAERVSGVEARESVGVWVFVWTWVRSAEPVQRLELKLKVLQYRIFLAERAPELADTIKFVTLVSQKVESTPCLILSPPFRSCLVCCAPSPASPIHQAPELADTIKFVTLVSQKIQESQKLQHVLLVVRDIGNKLNEGTKKGKVVGFAANDLNKVANTKGFMAYLIKVVGFAANDLNKVANTKGFMAYLIKVLSECRPKWLYFWKDFTDGSLPSSPSPPCII